LLSDGFLALEQSLLALDRELLYIKLNKGSLRKGYTEPSIGASYQISSTLAKWF